MCCVCVHVLCVCVLRVCVRVLCVCVCVMSKHHSALVSKQSEDSILMDTVCWVHMCVHT